MSMMRTRIVTTLIPAAMMVLGSAAWALAQTPKVEKILTPAVPPVGKSDTLWMPSVAAVLLALLVVGVNFIPSKRGHQD